MQKLTLKLLLGLSCVFAFQVNAQDISQTMTDHFDHLLENNRLESQDVQWEITAQNVSSTSGVTNVYFRQVINGIQVYGTESGVHTMSNGTVIAESNHFISNAAQRAGASTPSLTALQAVQAAANQLNYSISENLSVVEQGQGPSQKTTISEGGISLSPIPAQLMYQLNEANELVLAWDLSIQSITHTDWWSVRVDASTGEIIDRINWMVTCAIEHDHSAHEVAINYNTNLFDIPNYDALNAEATAGCSECYEVVAFPVESPNHGPRTLEMQPANLTASPFGWHDTDGVAGAESTLTIGNNVDAVDPNSGFRPDGGSTLDFQGYPFNPVYTNANQYEAAAVTNLFYVNNIIHDVASIYGFDEAGGNFQENNYGNGGLGGDYVEAFSQIDQFCNATFGTPPDGGNPSMNMYICNDKDGSFDNMVIVHEFGHGISIRLTGGPGTSGCLGTSEQMGEGWSDYFGAILTIEPGDTGTDARPVGTYLFGQPTTGNGIRPFPYSTDMAVNPHTYNDIGSVSIPHGVGSVWANMLWEMTWGLIDEHGWDPDIYNFTGDVNQDAGNVMAMALVIEALKLQPCGPGFVDGRDAIFAADAALYGGANECIIWDAFAKRGLGLSASQGSPNSVNDGVEAFDTPSGVAELTAPADVCLSEPILNNVGGGTPFGGVYNGPGVTDNGDGATYDFDPATAGTGVHIISYEVQAGTCSVASTATDTIEVLAVPGSPTTTGVTGFCVGDDVTVTATLNDTNNVIRWFDAPTDGNFLFEGTSYTFTPAGSVDVYAQENPPGLLNQLVISEFTLETPDRLEIQNVGVGADYSGYYVATSDQPYTDINSQNATPQELGVIGGDAVVTFSDDQGASDYWGSNIWWNNDGTGWIIVIDPAGNVVDSVFWNFTAAEIAGLNITINGFNITAADLDWTGPGAVITAEWDDSFQRMGESDSAADWADVCLQDSYGVANTDIGIGFQGCLGTRTIAEVVVETTAPDVVCPADVTEIVNAGDTFTVPDYTLDAVATDNCTAAPTLTQDLAIGSNVGMGVYPITITATDAAGNEDTCTFTLTVDEILGLNDADLSTGIVVFPNPTQGDITIRNNSTIELTSAVITDVNGRIIQNLDLTGSGAETNFSIESLATGLYFVRINSENTSIVKRVVKR